MPSVSHSTSQLTGVETPEHSYCLVWFSNKANPDLVYHRLGELLPSSASIALSNPFPMHSNFKRSLQNPLACLLHLPHTKTHHHSQDIILVNQRDPINLISLLKNHIWVNTPLEGQTSVLFFLNKRILTPNKNTRPLTLQQHMDLTQLPPHHRPLLQNWGNYQTSHRQHPSQSHQSIRLMVFWILSTLLVISWQYCPTAHLPSTSLSLQKTKETVIVLLWGLANGMPLAGQSPLGVSHWLPHQPSP